MPFWYSVVSSRVQAWTWQSDGHNPSLSFASTSPDWSKAEGPGYLFVRFKDKTGALSATCRYADDGGALARALHSAASKGAWVNSVLAPLGPNGYVKV